MVRLGNYFSVRSKVHDLFARQSISRVPPTTSWHSITPHYAILPRSRCVQVVAGHGLQRVYIIDDADFIDADLMITDVMDVLSILSSCAEIACRHLWC